jgi:hypothetical protein
MTNKILQAMRKELLEFLEGKRRSAEELCAFSFTSLSAKAELTVNSVYIRVLVETAAREMALANGSIGGCVYPPLL